MPSFLDGVCTSLSLNTNITRSRVSCSTNHKTKQTKVFSAPSFFLFALRFALCALPLLLCWYFPFWAISRHSSFSTAAHSHNKTRSLAISLAEPLLASPLSSPFLLVLHCRPLSCITMPRKEKSSKMRKQRGCSGASRKQRCE